MSSHDKCSGRPVNISASKTLILLYFSVFLNESIHGLIFYFFYLLSNCFILQVKPRNMPDTLKLFFFLSSALSDSILIWFVSSYRLFQISFETFYSVILRNISVIFLFLQLLKDRPLPGKSFSLSFCGLNSRLLYKI